MLLGATMLLASCGVKKAAVNDAGALSSSKTASVKSAETARLAFVQKVSDQKVYAQNIVGNISFRATMGDKDVTLPGALRMRKDKVIRLQLFIPILGTEVGRLEFTPDYVLVVDRMHKQYVKGDYNQLDFLRQNGLNFYSLQALFWNQLLLPGATKVGEGDLRKFDVNLDETGQYLPISLVNGNLKFVWLAGRDNGRIAQADVNYASGGKGRSTLLWKYTDFKAVGAKMFPGTQEFSFSTNATNNVRKMTVRIEMGDVKTSDDWEEQTTVSDKYKKMDALNVLGKLLNQ